MKPFVLLFGAITCEVLATLFLKASDGFTRPLPSLIVVAGYATAFWLLSRSLQTLHLGTAYAIWSGLGTATTVAVGVLWFREPVDAARITGILLILSGVFVLNLWSPPAAAHP